jgi:His-Xaa-Ser repeat protein HxsA
MTNVFLIPSLMAAGFVKPDTVQVNFTNMTSGGTQPGGATLFELFKQQHSVMLADHRSHSSHSSHSSHRSGSTGGHFSHSSHTSHRSSYGGDDTPSATSTPGYPSYSPSGPNSNDGARSSSPSDVSQSLFSAPPIGTGKLPSLSGRTKRFLNIVRRVQIGLLAQGVYDGPINGVVGPLTRSALRRFQSDHGLDVTGTITPATLDALKVPTD